jgi:hypothetical protein
MPRRPPGGGSGLPFGFEIALRLQSDQQWIESPRFEPSGPHEIIAVAPILAGFGKDREH